MVSRAKGAGKGQQDVPAEVPDSSKPRLRSPARNRSPEKPRRALRRSPGRTKSPAPKSPARTRSPGRKSPGRPRKETQTVPLQASTPKVVSPKAASSASKVASPKARNPIRRSPSRKSPTRGAAIGEKVTRPRKAELYPDTDSDSPDWDVPYPQEKPQAAVRGRARRLEVQIEKLDLNTDENTSTSNLITRKSRTSQNRDVEEVDHSRNFDIARRLCEFSDEDEITIRKSVSVDRVDFQQITEFGGTLGAIFYMIATPLTVFWLLTVCNQKVCSFSHVPEVLDVNTWFNLTAVVGFFCYAILLAIFSVIPFGGKKIFGLPTKQGKFRYVMNGLFSSFILIAIGIGLEWKKIPITEFIIKHLVHLMIASTLFGFILTIYAFIRSFYVSFRELNAHVLGRNQMYAFFMGRELNPRAFGYLDLKMYVFRLALIGSILLDVTFFYNSFGLNVTPTLVILVVLHLVYYVDALLHEPAFVSSFEIQYEGFGYMTGIGYLIYPFMMSSVTKYVIDHNINLPVWTLTGTNLLFILGYVLFRGSNNQKDAFRKNPYDPSLSHLETIPTTRGKKLICSGFWGFVRHPNYLGDILMNLSFIPFAATVPPVITSITIILFLIHRSVRDHIRCKHKYGTAWERYCSKVRYVLLPKVY